MVINHIISAGSNSLASLAVEGPEGSEVMLTYEHLQSLIESCLVEAGYYEVQGSRFKSYLTPALLLFVWFHTASVIFTGAGSTFPHLFF